MRGCLMLTVALLVAACGGNGGGGNGGGNVPLQGLLAGNPADSASAHLAATDGPATANVDPNGVLLDRLLVAITPAATVAQFNAAARSVGAVSIVSARPGSLLIVLATPPQTGAAELGQLAATLRMQPGIAQAWPGRQAKAQVLPELAPADLAYLLPTRFPQAWNARYAAPANCSQQSVDVYVWDEFGDPTPGDFFDQIDAGRFVMDQDLPPTGAEMHGYEVTSVLAAQFDAVKPTGADPFQDCVRIHQVQAAGMDMTHAVRHLMDVLGRDALPHVIVNSSLDFDTEICGAHGNEICDASTLPNTTATSLQLAMTGRMVAAGEWASLAHAVGFTNRVVMVQAAGNIDAPDDMENPPALLAKAYAGFRSAVFASPAALATHIDELRSLVQEAALWQPNDTAGAGLPDLMIAGADFDVLQQLTPDLTPGNGLSAANLLIVGSLSPVANTSAETVDELQRSNFSFDGADVGAVGVNVVLPAGLEAGTSFTAPQVAGLAAFLWNLSPALEAQGVAATVDLIKRTSAQPAASPLLPAIDAYAAVLQLDDVAGCCAGNTSAPVRLALMDADRDGTFDGSDLQSFVDAYHLADPNAPTIPSQRDFSEFDLNGDGYTGGIPITAFDLDVNGLDASGRANINATDELVEGYQTTFNEAALSDLQILCYYAYSPLYASDQGGPNDTARTQLLGPDRCVGLHLDAQFPAQISGSTQLSVDLQKPVGGGQYAAADNVLTTFTPSCGTANPSSGRTDASGSITTSVTPAAGCTSVSIDIVGSADIGTAPLVRQTISATVAPIGRVLSGPVHLTYDRVLTTATGNGDRTAHGQLDALVRVAVDADGRTATVIEASGSLNYQSSGTDTIGCYPNGPDGGLDTRTVTTGGSDSWTFSGGSLVGYDLYLSGTYYSQDSTWLEDCSIVTTNSGPTDGSVGGSGSPFRMFGDFIQDSNGQLQSIDFTANDQWQDVFGAQITRVVSGSLTPEP